MEKAGRKGKRRKEHPVLDAEGHRQRLSRLMVIEVIIASSKFGVWDKLVPIPHLLETNSHWEARIILSWITEDDGSATAEEAPCHRQRGAGSQKSAGNLSSAHKVHLTGL